MEKSKHHGETRIAESLAIGGWYFIIYKEREWEADFLMKRNADHMGINIGISKQVKALIKAYTRPPKASRFLLSKNPRHFGWTGDAGVSAESTQ